MKIIPQHRECIWCAVCRRAIAEKLIAITRATHSCCFQSGVRKGWFLPPILFLLIVGERFPVTLSKDRRLMTSVWCSIKSTPLQGTNGSGFWINTNKTKGTNLYFAAWSNEKDNEGINQFAHLGRVASVSGWLEGGKKSDNYIGGYVMQ